MTERFCFVGFDSAWTDNLDQPGAIAAAVFEGGVCIAEREPCLAGFNDAASFIESVSHDCSYTMIALDQPSVVPNATGMRPVEKVAGSIVNASGGGVQPANRGRADMFGDSAPVWRFLDRLRARQNPLAARTAVAGRFLVEVFPALALHAWLPPAAEPKRAPKYNPGNKRRFLINDWVRVCLQVATRAEAVGLAGIAAWVEARAAMPKPLKCDQDKLDAVICLLIALSWRFGEEGEVMCLGDATSGYIVTAASPAMRMTLSKSASIRGVPVDWPWPSDADHALVDAMPMTPSRARVPSAKPFQQRVAVVAPAKAGKIAFDEAELRAYLIEAARARRTVTYGETALHFGHPRHQGTYTALTAKLNAIAAGNKARGEPLLMALVVNKDARLPGPGFFREARIPSNADQRAAFNEHCKAVFAYRWT